LSLIQQDEQKKESGDTFHTLASRQAVSMLFG